MHIIIAEGSLQRTALDNLDANMFAVATRERNNWQIGDEMGELQERSDGLKEKQRSERSDDDGD